MRAGVTRVTLTLRLAALLIVAALIAVAAIVVTRVVWQPGLLAALRGDTLSLILTALAVTGVCFLVALLLMALVSRRFLTRPIAELVAGTRAIAGGDLSVRIPVQRNDELGELAESFNVMAAELVQAQQLLEQRVRERTHELATLLEVSRTVASTLELAPLLDLVLDQLQSVVKGSSAIIMTLEGDELAVLEYRGPAPREQVMAVRVPLAGATPYEEVIRDRVPLTRGDVRGDTPLSRAFQRETGRLRTDIFGYARSWMGAPLLLKDRVIGMMAIVHHKPNYYTHHHKQLAGAIAAQAAVAIENARLYAHAHELAALEERSRLARELHDSVTQALFSMTLHMRAVQMAQERAGIDPDSALGRGMRQLSELSQGALAEMRALIFELRPGALAEEGLAAALDKQATALGAREGMQIKVNAPPGARLALEAATEEHLYRLALEALHNVVKHANAAHAWVLLDVTPEGDLVLEVGDDGVGFDTTVERPGHLGLGTMAERATQLGGHMEITSAPGQGTVARLVVPGACRRAAETT